MAKILIVDDDPDILDAGRLVLEREGYEVATAPNRAEGMAKVEEFKPDLLILDVMMEEPDDGLAWRASSPQGLHAARSSCSPASTPPWASTSTRTTRWSRSTSSSPSRSSPQTLIAKVKKLLGRVGEAADARPPNKTSSATTSTRPRRAARAATAARSSRSCRTSRGAYREIDADAMQIIADLLDIHPVEVYSVASFYAFLHGARRGPVRRSASAAPLSCDFAGKDAVAAPLESELGIGFDETTDDGLFTLEWASCVGMCDQGPALLVNDQVHTRVTPETGARDRRRVPAAVGGHATERRGSARHDASRHRATRSPTRPSSPTPASRPRSPCRAPTSSTRCAPRGLKGRGGAGFPTGMKWNFCAAREGRRRSTSSATPTRASPARSRTA